MEALDNRPMTLCVVVLVVLFANICGSLGEGSSREGYDLVSTPGLVEPTDRDSEHRVCHKKNDHL